MNIVTADRAIMTGSMAIVTAIADIQIAIMVIELLGQLESLL
jgi:hypothetical protein